MRKIIDVENLKYFAVSFKLSVPFTVLAFLYAYTVPKTFTVVKFQMRQTQDLTFAKTLFKINFKERFK